MLRRVVPVGSLEPLPGVVYPIRGRFGALRVRRVVSDTKRWRKGFRKIAAKFPDNIALLGPELAGVLCGARLITTRLAAGLLAQWSCATRSSGPFSVGGNSVAVDLRFSRLPEGRF